MEGGCRRQLTGGRNGYTMSKYVDSGQKGLYFTALTYLHGYGIKAALSRETLFSIQEHFLEARVWRKCVYVCVCV